jgi:hypothetical protein
VTAKAFRRERVESGYLQVPNGLWTLPVSMGARVLLGWLHSHSDDFLDRLTVNKCRRILGTSSIRKFMEELEPLGLVEIVRAPKGSAWSFVLKADAWLALSDRAEVGSPPSRDRLTNRAEAGSLTEPKSARGGRPVEKDQLENSLAVTGEDETAAHGSLELASGAEVVPANETRKEQAARITQRWWEWKRSNTGKAPIANFAGTRAIIAKVLESGYTEQEVKQALVKLNAVSYASIARALGEPDATFASKTQRSNDALRRLAMKGSA